MTAPALRRLPSALLIVSLLLLCSGAAGLVYQVVWVRLLGLAFGVTVFAVSTVLAAFMGGLAIGSLFGGRLADRLQRPLRTYAFVELGIGLTALATPTIFASLQDLYRAISLSVDPAQAPLLAGVVRGVITFAILLIPTALMGASLPLAVRGVRRALASNDSVSGDTRAMGILYALNTTGAIAGTLAAGFLLIGSFGIQMTVALAAALNLAAGAGALILSFLSREGQVDVAVESDAHPEPAVAPTALDSRLATAAFWTFGISGAVSLAYEVVWSRVLAILFNTTIYGFVIMLTTVLFGIALGSAVMGWLVTKRPSTRFSGISFGLIELGIGAGAIFSLAAFGGVYDLLFGLQTTDPLSFFGRLLRTDIRLMVATCVLTILPAALCMGASFPVAARLWAAGATKLGSRLGGVYAVNVAGAIVGSLAAGFILVPTIGAHASLLVLAAMNLLLGCWLFICSGAPRLTTAGSLFGGLILALGYLQAPVHAQVFKEKFPTQELLWYHEGLENTVSIAKAPSGIRTLYTNSRGQSNDEVELVRFYRRIGHLGALLAPDSTNALVVGMGSGVTGSVIAQHPGNQLQIVELSDGMVAAAPFYQEQNRDLLNLPNVKIAQDDGRNYLLRERGEYGLVTADVVHPYDAGSNNLYSVEYFRLAARALAPDGIMMQWTSPESEYEHKLIIRTFLEVFPYVTLWREGDILIGSKQPLKLDRAALQARMDHPEVKDSLVDVGLTDADAFLDLFNADQDELRVYAGPGMILSDERPVFEYFFSLDIPKRSPDLSGFSRDPSRVTVQRP